VPGIPRALLQEARPIGAGPRFQPPISGQPTGHCSRRLGRRAAVHVELFAKNRVVIVPAGIGTHPPRRLIDGQIAAALCYGDLVTLAPTGVALVAAGRRLTLAVLFRSWGEPLSSSRLASFRARPGTHVTAFVDGHRWHASPRAIPLLRHSEIVLELGPYVPPHHSFAFPPGS